MALPRLSFTTADPGTAKRGIRRIVRHSREGGNPPCPASAPPGRAPRRGASGLAACPLAALPLLSTALLSLAVFPLMALARDLPERFEATFTLEASGMTIARTRWSLSPGTGGRYVSTSRTEPAGAFSLISNETRVERSEWIYAEDWLQPLAYHYERTGRKAREIGITFDWEANIAIHESPKGAWKLPVPPGAMDKFNYILALMRDLSRGERRFEYTIADGGRLRRYMLTGVGEERIETALGTFDTVVVRRERENGKRETTFWCASELGFFPVKIVHLERDGTSMALRIESLDGIRRHAP